MVAAAIACGCFRILKVPAGLGTCFAGRENVSRFAGTTGISFEKSSGVPGCAGAFSGCNSTTASPLLTPPLKAEATLAARECDLLFDPSDADTVTVSSAPSSSRVRIPETDAWASEKLRRLGELREAVDRAPSLIASPLVTVKRECARELLGGDMDENWTKSC